MLFVVGYSIVNLDFVFSPWVPGNHVLNRSNYLSQRASDWKLCPPDLTWNISKHSSVWGTCGDAKTHLEHALNGLKAGLVGLESSVGLVC